MIFLSQYVDTPICDPTNRKKYGVLVGETIRINCTVISKPLVQRFRWWYSTEMGERIEFDEHEFTKIHTGTSEGDFSYSVLSFTYDNNICINTINT